MGFLDSQKAKERDLSDLRARAQEKLTAGVGQFVLPFPTGSGNTFDRQRRLDMATDALAGMGINVAHVERLDWEYKWMISCLAPARPAPTMPLRPISTFSSSPQVSIPTNPWDLDSYISRVLEPWCGAAQLGKTFGRGHGFEQAWAALAGVNGDSPTFRAVRDRTADTLVEALRQKQISLDIYDDALGYTSPALAAAGVSEREGLPMLNDMTTSKDFLIAIASEDLLKLRAFDGPAGVVAFLYNKVALGRLTGS